MISMQEERQTCARCPDTIRKTQLTYIAQREAILSVWLQIQWDYIFSPRPQRALYSTPSSIPNPQNPNPLYLQVYFILFINSFLLCMMVTNLCSSPNEVSGSTELRNQNLVRVLRSAALLEIFSCLASLQILFPQLIFVRTPVCHTKREIKFSRWRYYHSFSWTLQDSQHHEAA